MKLLNKFKQFIILNFHSEKGGFAMCMCQPFLRMNLGPFSFPTIHVNWTHHLHFLVGIRVFDSWRILL